MSTSKARPILLILGALILIVAIVAVVKRDKVADLILRGGDLLLAGEPAQSSPHAAIALDFLGALRAKDQGAIARLATAEQLARFDQEMQQPNADSQETSSMMLEDLPADPAALRSKIKSVQGHKDRAVVLFETKANSWFVQLVQVDGTWKVSGY
jgi:hypothetical protein